jgi:putative iron-dependent peroxidase
MRPTPQPGIFAVGTRAHHHLEFDVVEGADLDALMSALQGGREHATTVAGVNVVIGLGRDLCSQLAPEWLPAAVEPFETIRGTDNVVIPGDQHDLWIWLHSFGPDGVFDLARRAGAALRGLATVVREQPRRSMPTPRTRSSGADCATARRSTSRTARRPPTPAGS